MALEGNHIPQFPFQDKKTTIRFIIDELVVVEKRLQVLLGKGLEVGELITKVNKQVAALEAVMVLKSQGEEVLEEPPSDEKLKDGEN